MRGDHLFEKPPHVQEAERAAHTYHQKTRMLDMCDLCGAQGGVQTLEDGINKCSPSCGGRAGGNGSRKPLSRPDVFQSVETKAIVALAQATHDLERIIKLLGGK